MDEKTLQVLLAVDGSPHSEVAVMLTAGVAWPPGTTAHALAVVPERWSLSGLGPEAQRVVDETVAKVRQVEWASAERIAAQAAERLRARGLTAEPETREGRPSEVILQRAAELPADLIVIGARGLSAPDEFQLGSTAHKLAHYAACSVLVTRPPELTQPLSVIRAADGSPEARRAAEFLCALSLPQWAEVTVVSVAEAAVALPAGEREPVANVPEVVRRALLDAAEVRAAEVTGRLSGCGAQVRSAIRFGHPSGEILAAAREQDADLIVIGARGQTRAAPFPLGGVAQKVVKYAPCSVLVVR
ncbi:MAG: universal stress protein [Chloroflexota bacterium]